MEAIFRSENAARDNFLSRLFGLFNEELIRIWAASPRAPYEDLGRPHLRGANEPYGHTLDFALRDRDTGRVYVAEMKCELAYENYRYLCLTTADQLDHHKGAAFTKFRQVARDPESWPVTVSGRPVQVHGAVLVWGAATPEGVTDVIDRLGMHDVLAVDDALQDLQTWDDPTWRGRIEELSGWANELFDGLGGGSIPNR